MIRCKIEQLSAYVPDRVVDNAQVEKWVNRHRTILAPGALEKLFGIKERRFADSDTQVSDLAVAAAQAILAKTEKASIDLLIFAAASSDLIEPATANIVQSKLGLTCPVMDLKNACNSFVSAIQTATAFIQAGIHQKVLIVNGEKLSDAINFKIEDEEQLKRSLAAFSLGDAGCAALITKAEAEEGFYFQKFRSVGKHWELCTIQGGGSRYPHDPSKLYFEGQTVALKDALLEEAQHFIHDCLAESQWRAADIKHLFTHQVSNQTFKVISEATGIGLDKSVSIFERFGNTAAASIPLAMYCAQQHGKLQKGDKIALIGLAAGISASVQLMVW